MAAKPAAADTEEFVSVVWCTTLGIPGDVANKLVAARWRVAGLTEDKSKFEKLLEQAGCLAGDIDAAWRKWQAASVDAQRKVVVAGSGTAVQPSGRNEHTPPRDLRAAEPELKPSPARSSAPSSSVESNKTPSKQDWQDFVTESLLVNYRVQVDRAAQVSQSHKQFLQELVTACKAAAAPRDWTFAFESEDSRKAFKNKILQRVDECDGCNEATWGINVFTPVLMRMFGEEFKVSAEENIPLLAATGTFRADVVLGQRLSDKTSEELILFHSIDLTNRPGTRCVGLPVQAEYKRSQIGSDEAINRRKLGCQLLLAMEHQEAVLESLKVSPELLSYLKFPWAVGLLMDNKGVTFCYMSHASDAGKRVYFNIALKWATEFDAILRGLAVVRDYVHLFWDMMLHLIHHAPAAAFATPEPAWRSPLLARFTPGVIQDPAKHQNDSRSPVEAKHQNDSRSPVEARARLGHRVSPREVEFLQRELAKIERQRSPP